MRRFLRPNFRRPLPDFLTPKADSWFGFENAKVSTTTLILQFFILSADARL
jgi:hypothetical protein